MAITLRRRGVRVTLTIGAAECQPGESLEACIRRADQALYTGKQSGRNRVVCAKA